MKSGKVLGGEGGDAGELDLLLAGTQGVADGEDARVEQADDVACVGFIDDGAVLRHQLGAGGQLDVLALLHVVGFHAALELARADAHEGDTVAVGLVHVGLNFEDEGREPRVPSNVVSTLIFRLSVLSLFRSLPVLAIFSITLYNG